MSEYAHPEVLVTTDWVSRNLGRPGIKLIEVDVDSKSYEAGHIPDAVGFDWQTQLNNTVRRDILSREEFEALMQESGVSNGDTVVLYGDNNNWFAAFAFWIFKMYGHDDVRLMNGGRVKWLNEDDKDLTVDETVVTPSSYTVTSEQMDLRAMLPDVLSASQSSSHNLVDVRSVDEFTGKVIAPPGMSETAQRGGHIPGARNVPWATAVAADGTFKPRVELEAIYTEQQSLDRGKPTIAYCRIGERSSHTWFALKYLLGYENVRNYDGSWTEYGNLIGAPIDKPSK